MNEKFYLGTYTKRVSKGVYSVTLNKETDQLGISDIRSSYRQSNVSFILEERPIIIRRWKR